MAEVIWTEPAREGLNDIVEYVGLSNPKAAKDLILRVLQSVERLSDFPESGRVVPELPELSYQEIISNPCRILYQHKGEQVFILHVMRQERDLRRFILKSLDG